MYRKWGTLVLFLLATPILALAQNTGKLSGVVTDASTGETLPGANVVIVGTQLGTATDVDGSYFILGVPVGTYDVQASFVGYQAQTMENVDINAGYTRELNFALSPGAELDEIVVEYERPMIQKDAIGVPKVVTAEQISNLPVRGLADVAALQAGVVKQEGSNALHIRGGREQEVTFYVDGVKVIGSAAVPTQAIQEQEMLIGSIPAKYGDAMSGIINITTKSGARNFFGSVEAITSEGLDAFGHNSVSGTFGGPIVGDRLNFFLSGEYGNFDDPSPRAVGFPTIDNSVLDDLRMNPQAVRAINDETGEIIFVPFPGDVASGTPASEAVERINVPEGYHLASSHPVPTFRPLSFTDEDISTSSARPNSDQTDIKLNGNVMLSPTDQIRIRAGGGFEQLRGKSFQFLNALYSPESFRDDDRDTWRAFASWTHYLSPSTFYQFQASYSDFQRAIYWPGFSSDVQDVLNYGDIDNSFNDIARRYVRYDSETDTYMRAYSDGNLPNFRDIHSTWAPPGAPQASDNFQQWHQNQLAFRANATTQIGLHQIEFGGEFERQTRRYYTVDPGSYARFVADEDGAEVGTGVQSWEELEFNRINNNAFYYGYNYLGTEEVDTQNIDNFTLPSCEGATTQNCYSGDDKFNVAPFEPIYYAGYIQDKIEYRDLVLNLGVRLDVFDNNAPILKDDFALLPIVRANEVSGRPSNIGSDYAVYFDNSERVVGYRDLDGNFYNASGADAEASAIRNAGQPQVVRDAQGNEIRRVTSDVFTDYEPQVNFQPRIGVSFPVTDQALFFASYDVVTQRPSENQFDTIQQIVQTTERSKRIDNPALEPERTTNYELGFRQRVGQRAAFTVSGFYRQIENKISLRIVQNAFPNNYQTFYNVDFGTVRGAEFEFDLRRTNNVSLNANYTLSFAQGTGADASSTGQIVWRQESDPFYPRFISPLDFDQRHKLNLTVDYRLADDEGPMLFGAHPLANFGVNLVGTFASGMPYTLRDDSSPMYTSFNGFLQGGVNEQTMPATALLNLRVDRRFSVGGNANLVAFLWVQNLLNSNNVVGIYNQTGLPDNDAYLTNAEGQDAIKAISESQSPLEGQSFADHYRAALRTPFNYGIPRMTRLGLRLDF